MAWPDSTCRENLRYVPRHSGAILPLGMPKTRIFAEFSFLSVISPLGHYFLYGGKYFAFQPPLVGARQCFRQVVKRTSKYTGE